MYFLFSLYSETVSFHDTVNLNPRMLIVKQQIVRLISDRVTPRGVAYCLVLIAQEGVNKISVLVRLRTRRLRPVLTPRFCGHHDFLFL